MATRQYTIASGARLVSAHLSGWSFGLDHARTRVGCCHHTDRRITCSTYLIAYLAPDEVDQVILHEVAHALAGPRAGHGPAWKKAAQRLGYAGGRCIEVPEARMSARWRGSCSDGHEILRHRKPSRRVYCGTCWKTGIKAAITWQDRGVQR